MFAYVLIALEVMFFLLTILYVFRRNSPEYKVSKDIWGVYEGTNNPNRHNISAVLVFYRDSSCAAWTTSSKNAKFPKNPGIQNYCFSNATNLCLSCTTFILFLAGSMTFISALVEAAPSAYAMADEKFMKTNAFPSNSTVQLLLFVNFVIVCFLFLSNW